MAAAKRALLSVSDKRGLEPLARGLVALGWELVSTGGTAKALLAAGLPVRAVADVTGAPEILGGRVKTLHPKIHGGILARRGLAADEAELAANAITPIELVVVNLYPFREAVARGLPFEGCVEEIDVGGPAMVRAAAKNAAHVGVVVDPADYERVLEAARAGALPQALRRELMAKAFAHTAAYDAAIAAWLSTAPAEGDAPPVAGWFSAIGEEGRALRYGENPHQRATFYRTRPAPDEPTVAWAEVLGGKELSYNNLLDLEAALGCVLEFEAPAAVVVKHNNPCGVATGASVAQAFARAREVDPVSAFGGIVALNREVDAEAAAELHELFLECVIAPGYTAEARAALADKKNLRLLAEPKLRPGARRTAAPELRSLRGGLLVQSPDLARVEEAALRVVTRRAPTESERDAALFAFRVCKHVRSNAIVFATPERVLAIGAGQMSRVDSARIARTKARTSLEGSAAASDAFFPFRDGLDELRAAGATCVIQPGGSVRDAEVIAAADEAGLAMLFTGVRHFRH